MPTRTTNHASTFLPDPAPPLITPQPWRITSTSTLHHPCTLSLPTHLLELQLHTLASTNESYDVVPLFFIANDGLYNHPTAASRPPKGTARSAHTDAFCRWLKWSPDHADRDPTDHLEVCESQYCTCGNNATSSKSLAHRIRDPEITQRTANWECVVAAGL